MASWLTLMGWQVEIDQEGGLYVAVAHHVTASGDRLSVGACGGTRVEVGVADSSRAPWESSGLPTKERPCEAVAIL